MSRHLAQQNSRLLSAAEALVAARAELRGSLAASDPAMPRLYAGYILASDDELGARSGLIVQGDNLTWEAIDALFDLAIYGSSEHRRQAHPRGGYDIGCPFCKQGDRVWSVHLAGVVAGRREQTATAIGRAVRAAFASALPGPEGSSKSPVGEAGP